MDGQSPGGSNIDQSSGGSMDESTGGSLSGGSPGSGGAMLATGGESSSGGASGGELSTGGAGGSFEETGGAASGGTETGGSGGTPSGGSGSGGDVGTGGSMPTVIWSGSYEGDSVALNGDSKLRAQLFLDYPDCSMSLGRSFEPGDSGTFYPESTYDMSCANPDKAPVAQFGPMEWELAGSTGTLTSENTVRFTLTVFDASPWPATSGTNVYVSFEWEVMTP